MPSTMDRKMGSQSSQASTGATLIGGAQYAPVDRILYRDQIDGLMSKPHFFSDYSSPDVFEIRRAGGKMISGLDDDSFLKYLSGMNGERNEDVLGRIVFIGGREMSSDKINATAEVFEALCDSLSVSSTFMACIHHQQMPGANVVRHPRSRQVIRHDMWYSMIQRTRHTPENKEAFQRRESYAPDHTSRMTIDWSRMNVWARHDPLNHKFTALVLRCPDDLNESFVSTFSGPQGSLLLDHPTLLHAYLVNDFLSRSYDFVALIAQPMYDWELGSRKEDDATKRSQAFLEINREVSQVATDYKILTEAIKLLKKEHLRLQDLYSAASEPIVEDFEPSYEITYYFNDEIFDQYLTQTEMIQTYSNLYIQRAIIGMNEGFALANQRDADINIKISQAAYRDGKVLESIQYLTMIFLPPSLAAAIFGMGFFATNTDEEGRIVFSIAKQWWYYLAVSGCLLVGTSIFMMYLRFQRKRRAIKLTANEKV